MGGSAEGGGGEVEDHLSVAFGELMFDRCSGRISIFYYLKLEIVGKYWVTSAQLLPRKQHTDLVVHRNGRPMSLRYLLVQ